jgi:hypothetical protein
MNSWAVPFVTNHKYRIYWDIGQLNWDKIDIEVANPWLVNDFPVLFNEPYTENYEVVEFFNQYNTDFATSGNNPSIYLPPQSLTTTAPANWLSGMSSFNNVTKEIDFVINGKASSSKRIEGRTTRCRYYTASWCVVPTVATACTGPTHLWSDPTTWPTGKVPAAGDDVEIPSGKIIEFDLASSPVLNLITVIGCLNFKSDNSIDQTLQAYQIFVLGGTLTIGSVLTPYSKKANIILYGDYNG